jgi:hypothetical protein
MTVRAIRARFGDRLDIDPLSQAVIDGQGVDDDTTVRAGQLVAFIRKAGEKGTRQPFKLRAQRKRGG